MSLRTRAVIVGVLGLLALCAGILVLQRTGSRETTIADVLAAPDDYNGSLVRVSGRASDITPIDVQGYRVFRLSDDAGKSIWVVTKQGAPTDGSAIQVEGRANTGIAADLPVIGKLQLGTYLIEEQRLDED